MKICNLCESKDGVKECSINLHRVFTDPIISPHGIPVDLVRDPTVIDLCLPCRSRISSSLEETALIIKSAHKDAKKVGDDVLALFEKNLSSDKIVSEPIVVPAPVARRSSGST